MNNTGLSLLELLVVVLIVGLLIGLILPALMEFIGFARVTEAFENIGVIHRAVERCRLMAGGDTEYTVCNEFSSLDIEDPGSNPEASYKYQVGVIYWGNQSSSVIQATSIDTEKSTKNKEKVLVIYDPPENIGGKASFITAK